MHAVMSLVGAGRFAEADRLIADREAYVATERHGVTNQAMTARVGLPVCRALTAFGRGHYGEVVELLYPIRNRVNEFGGSHAQRDAVHRTLLEAAIRNGSLGLARTLVGERIDARPTSPYNWLKQAAVTEGLGDRAAAAVMRARAGELRRTDPQA